MLTKCWSKSEGKSSLGRPSQRWDDNTKTCEHNTEPFTSIKGREFTTQVNNSFSQQTPLHADSSVCNFLALACHKILHHCSNNMESPEEVVSIHTRKNALCCHQISTSSKPMNKLLMAECRHMQEDWSLYQEQKVMR
jgi:hypothetical protein